MFLPAFCILVGLVGLVVCGGVLMMRVTEQLADLDAESYR